MVRSLRDKVAAGTDGGNLMTNDLLKIVQSRVTRNKLTTNPHVSGTQTNRQELIVQKGLGWDLTSDTDGRTSKDRLLL